MVRNLLSIRLFLLFGAVAIAATLAFAGCGGDNSSASVGEITVDTGSLSKEEFIKRADTICQAGRSRFNNEYAASLQKEEPGPSEAAQEAWIAGVVNKIFVPTYESTVKQINELGAPSGDEKQIAVYLDSVQQRLDELRAKPSELAGSAPFTKQQKLALAYGMKGCAGSFG